MAEVIIKQCDLCRHTVDPRTNPPDEDVIEPLSVKTKHPNAPNCFTIDVCGPCARRVRNAIVTVFAELSVTIDIRGFTNIYGEKK